MRVFFTILIIIATALSVSAQREGNSEQTRQALLKTPVNTEISPMGTDRSHQGTSGIDTASGDAYVDPSSPYFTLIDEAEEAVAQSRWNDAARALKAAMRVEPGHPTNILLMSNLGMIYFHAGSDSLALEMLNAAHNMAPTVIPVLQNRARVLAVIGREDDAFDDYGRIIELDSTLTEPTYIHGMIALRKGLYDIAESDFKRLERLEPDGTNTLNGLSGLYRNTLRFKEALPYLDRLIEREPESYNYSARAVCRLFTDDLNGASEDIAEGLRLDPDDGELYLYRSLLNRARYRFDDARRDADRAITLGISPSRIPPMK